VLSVWLAKWVQQDFLRRNSVLRVGFEHSVDKVHKISILREFVYFVELLHVSNEKFLAPNSLLLGFDYRQRRSCLKSKEPLPDVLLASSGGHFALD